MKCVNRQAVGHLSSFFPAKRDEVAMTEDQEYIRMQRNGVTVEPLNFPATQSILWNRTSQGVTETLHLTTKRNIRLHINEKTLRLAHRHVNQVKSSFECFLVGSISVDSREDSIDVAVDRFDPGREVLVNTGSGKVRRKVPTTVVPGDHIVPMTLVQGLSGADSSVTHTKEEFQKAFQVLFSRISSQEPINLSHLVSLKVSCHSHGNDDEIIINVNCGTITMATRIQATPVAAVPIIPTALARNLSGPLRLSEVQGIPKSGYLTMDHTRKLLLLLESDPKAFSLPLLGIWVSGIYSIQHPFIWACCLRFIHSTAIQQRVFAPPNSFLLLLYSPVKSTPEFWECRQDKGESKAKMFEFYSCYENLHLELPPGPSSSDPLCFELFPAAGGLGRSLFEQAVEIWEKEQKQSRLNPDGIPPSQNQVVTSLKQGPADQDPSPVPRPSPSPHPQNLQFVRPDVTETSLSLSFDEGVPGERSEQGYANQQILPHPKPKQQQTNTQEQPQQWMQHDQENGQMKRHEKMLPGFVNNNNKGKEQAKQVRNNVTPQNSPSREPLKQILAPNQTHANVMNQKHTQLSQKPHPMQGSAVQRVPSQRGSRPGHNMQGRTQKVFSDQSIPRPKENRRQPSPKGPNVVHGTDSRRDQQKLRIQNQRIGSRTQHSERVDGRIYPNVPNQMSSLNHQDVENKEQQVDQQRYPQATDHLEVKNSRFPLPVEQVQRPILETVFEGETPDGTLNKSMSETEPEIQITGTSQATRGPLILPDSQRGVSNTDSKTYSSNNGGRILTERSWNTENREEGFTHPVVCGLDGNEERLDDVAGHTSESSAQWQSHERERQQSKPTDENTGNRTHEGTFPDNKQVADMGTGQANKECPEEEMERPDPYELLIRQEAQLRQLQEQIKLLLQQQHAPLPTPNNLLTPPRTPHFDSSHGNINPPDNSPVSMVTACTNTGASLFLGTPVKPSGKKSAATSPMKDNEMNHSRSLPASSTETSQHNCKESHRQDVTVNPEELANQVLELDDPSQTLASSLHAVDIPSFIDSPSGVISPSPSNQANRRGMESSFTSPVLGESASILVEQREKEVESHNTKTDDITEEESTAKKSNHVSLLQRDERQFYDNLLDQVKNILDQQVQEESSSENPSLGNEQNAHVTVHEPTREEVVMATMRELAKIKDSTLGTGNIEASKSPFSAKQWPLHRSASLNAIPDHPHINYLSFSVDETLDEVFSEADLKYLTNNQLQELQQISGRRKTRSRDRAVTFSVLQEDRSVLSRKGSVEKEHLCDASSVTAMDYTWNNLSMATKEYLGKYCLAPGKPANSASGTGNQKVVTKVTDITSETAASHTSAASQGCSAPPSTPEPSSKNESDSQILDITRLKKLPKLF